MSKTLDEYKDQLRETLKKVNGISDLATKSAALEGCRTIHDMLYVDDDATLRAFGMSITVGFSDDEDDDDDSLDHSKEIDHEFEWINLLLESDH